MAETYLSGEKEAMRALRDYEKSLLPALRKAMNTELSPILNPIENSINSSDTTRLKSAMPGMFHDGRTAWSGVDVKARVSLRPKDLIFIEGKGRSNGMGKQVGFEYAELAGIERRAPRPVSKGWGSSSVGYHSYIYNGQGKAFNKKLGATFGKPGRFLWTRVLKRKPEIEAKVEKIAEQFGIQLSRKINSNVKN
jgi:hypothetical protein